MTEEMKRKFARLTEIAPELNATTDAAARTIKEVERFLEDLNLGVSVRVGSYDEDTATRKDFETDTTQRLVISRYLAYGRVGDKFRVHVQHVTYLDEGDELKEIDSAEIPWANLPRQEKLESFAWLTYLIDSILSTSEQLVKRAKETSTSVDEMMDSLPKSRKR